ncbi:MAG: deoxyribodipyrimidine photo-lyase [Ignavibacteria bacterium]|nr:deoxyribodipyrimidine photo-lyase [Ignavibacteria bacterium]MBT8381071.1 deoxyribodipyrimidine photo-lyase [Ignavibacteria bacterium]MBT8392333.1 deoxyribodipyrimidine photo-lyase [Ignavibacteria bacterium]NNJ53247.1 deoxyribodipyrimidine photo-lyase [Ignavibacteriaceae bacterium]NNL19969.1 deoxyribodipyrimidine photo-lyase [Ignavibacteriaceae bacterium]
MNENRVKILSDGKENDGPVIYWMSRDQRVYDNWALLFAQELALEQKGDLIVLFSLVPEFLEATLRQYDFMLKGLMDVEKEFKKYNIPFLMLLGEPAVEIPKFIEKNKAGILVSDFDPLKIKRKWKNEIAKKIDIPFYEVDAHNIVPCIYASPKREFGAYTIRPKIHKNFPEFLDEFPKLKKMKSNKSFSSNKIDWKKIHSSLKVDEKVKPVDWLKPGEKAAHKTLKDFIENKIDNYDELRNDPNANVLSNLSPYLHFGQISAQRVSLVVNGLGDHPSADSFLEELVVRKELSDNFCFYNSNYDSFKGFPDWAKKTLNDHKKDEREFIYTLKKIEEAKTHEDLWNAAQQQLVTTGKLHGYMRMYWAKKILEWSKSPEDALKIAIYLNDKYELDGRDPNGYTGCAWAIGGVHDRAWTERPVYGKIRYMNRNGAKRKFDIEKYISKHSSTQNDLFDD